MRPRSAALRAWTAAPGFLALTGAVLVLPSCKASPTTAGSASGPAAEGRRLLEAGSLEAAAQKLAEAGDDPEALSDLGRVWMKKAETAPLPTPEPPPSPVPRGWEPPLPPEFKPEELQAMGFFERAIKAGPDHGGAHYALAQLLAPHAVRRHDRLQEAAVGRGRKGSRTAPPLPDAGGVDLSPARVARSFEAAVRSVPPLPGALEAFLQFAERTGDVEATNRAHQETIRRAGPTRDSAGPIARYGDFLRTVRKDQKGAIEQYRQALIWRPDDEATRATLAEIFIAEGIGHYTRQEYATAEARFEEAARYLPDSTSPQAKKVRDYKEKLAAIRR